MFSFLKARPALDPALVEWQFETCAWLLRHTGGYPQFAQTPLLLPTDEYFPVEFARGHDGVERLFLRVKELAGMAAWPCRLEPQEADPEYRIAPGVLVQGAPTGPLGTFDTPDGDVPVITYQPRVAEPAALVATFAHELAHYLIAGIDEPPPGGWEVHEPATDLAAVFLGFGVFLANTAFVFQQYSASELGWQRRGQGYLSETELVHALALFTALRGVPAGDVQAHLRGHLRPTFRRVLAGFESEVTRFDALRTIQPRAATPAPSCP